MTSPTLHSELGASKAHRWLACTASVGACRGIEEKSSSYAEEGTAAHMVGERCLRDPKLNPTDLVGQSITTPQGTEFIISDEMAEAVQVYVDYVRKVHKELGSSELWIEKSFDLSDVHEGMFGQNDASIYQPMGKLVVVDYKHGTKPVEAEDNPQLKFYGIGALKGAWDVEEVELVIVQPRSFHKKGKIRSWTTTPQALSKFAQEQLKAKAEEAYSSKARFVAGDHCKFCPYAPQCRALRDEAITTSMTVFSPYQNVPVAPLGKPAALTAEHLGKVLDFADVLKSWIKSVEDEAYDRAQRGDMPLGYKLVETTGHRKWKDEKEVVALVKDPAIVYSAPEVRSPAQIEKALKAAKIKLDISSLTMQKTGTTLVPITDSRPAFAKPAFIDTTAFAD